MPAFRKGESQSDYIARCIPYCIKNEGLTQTQAAGKCHGLWRNKHKIESKAVESKKK